MLTAEIYDTSFAFGGCRRHMATHTLTSSACTSSDMFGNSHRRTSLYLSNAGLTNSYVVGSEMTFLGNRNASVNAAFCCIEKRSFRSKAMASKAGMNTVTLYKVSSSSSLAALDWNLETAATCGDSMFIFQEGANVYS